MVGKACPTYLGVKGGAKETIHAENTSRIG
jgi:hypothetical protein